MANVKIVLQYHETQAVYRMLSKYADDLAMYQTKLDQYTHAFAAKLAQKLALDANDVAKHITVASSETCAPVNFIVFRSLADEHEERIENLFPSALDDASRIERARIALENKFGGTWQFVRFDA